MHDHLLEKKPPIHGQKHVKTYPIGFFLPALLISSHSRDPTDHLYRSKFPTGTLPTTPFNSISSFMHGCFYLLVASSSSYRYCITQNGQVMLQIEGKDVGQERIIFKGLSWLIIAYGIFPFSRGWAIYILTN